MEYYILMKNGEAVYNGSDEKEVLRKIPRSIEEHKGDVYDLYSLIRREGSTSIISRTNTGRKHLDSTVLTADKFNRIDMQNRIFEELIRGIKSKS